MTAMNSFPFLYISVLLRLLQDVYPGAPPSASIPASIAVRPEELLPEFLLRFVRTFPAEASLLFPGFCAADYYHPFSPWGENLISTSIRVTFAGAAELRPYDALAAWPGILFETIRSGG